MGGSISRESFVANKSPCFGACFTCSSVNLAGCNDRPAAAVALAQAPTRAPFTSHQLKPNAYWIEGGGGNSGVIVGDKGVIIIDAKTTAAGGKELLENVAKITPNQ